jgi:hypothetical protein
MLREQLGTLRDHPPLALIEKRSAAGRELEAHDVAPATTMVGISGHDFDSLPNVGLATLETGDSDYAELTRGGAGKQDGNRPDLHRVAASKLKARSAHDHSVHPQVNAGVFQGTSTRNSIIYLVPAKFEPGALL